MNSFVLSIVVLVAPSLVGPSVVLYPFQVISPVVLVSYIFNFGCNFQFFSGLIISSVSDPAECSGGLKTR